MTRPVIATLVYLGLAGLLLATHFVNAAPLPNERRKRSLENLNDNVIQTLKKMQHLQSECERGEFFSTSTYECESCDSATKHGSDVEYGHPCQAYYDEQKIDKLSKELNKIPWKWMTLTAVVTAVIIFAILAFILPRRFVIRQTPPSIEETGGRDERQSLTHEEANPHNDGRPGRVIVEPLEVIQGE